MSDLKEKVENILKHVAESQEIKNYKLIPNLDAHRGDGFLSEFYTGEVLNKDTGDLIKTYIKLPPGNKQGFNEFAYKNEYDFYSKIFPEFDKFQKEKKVKVPFDKVPKFYCGDVEIGDNEYIVLENLKVENFVLLDKSKPINEKVLKTIFETYGRYHALSFAFKEQNSERYSEFIRPIKDIFPMFICTQVIYDTTKASLELVYNYIKETDEDKAAKIKPLYENAEEFCKKGIVYDGKYSSLVHGDCWSNNFMFKFDAKGELEDLKILDFQLVRDSTPIHDLSYFFYSGAGKKDFDKLDEYLEIYYKSFSSFAKELGSDPKQLLPFDELRSEWKKYSVMGIIMSLMLWRVKLMSKEQVAQISQEKEYKEQEKNPVSDDVYKNYIRDIIVHAIEYGIL